MAYYSTHGISQFLLNNEKQSTVFIGPPCRFLILKNKSAKLDAWRLFTFAFCNIINNQYTVINISLIPS